MVRKISFKIIATGERLLQQGRETELNSKYHNDSWGFIVYEKSEGVSV